MSHDTLEWLVLKFSQGRAPAQGAGRVRGYVLTGAIAGLAFSLAWKYREERVRLVWTALLGRSIVHRVILSGGTLSALGNHGFIHDLRYTAPPAVASKSNQLRITNSQFLGSTHGLINLESE